VNAVPDTKRPFLTDANRDYYAGALMTVIGVLVACQGFSYKLGSLVRMGPGFFPVSLGTLLAILGVAIAIGNMRRTDAGAVVEREPAEWRAWGCILGGVAAFVVLGKYGGLVPATFVIVFLAAIGDRMNTWRTALVLALAMCAVAVVVFWWLLQIRLPLFGWG
jgi:hypothetical protein